MASKKCAGAKKGGTRKTMKQGKSPFPSKTVRNVKSGDKIPK